MPKRLLIFFVLVLLTSSFNYDTVAKRNISAQSIPNAIILKEIANRSTHNDSLKIAFKKNIDLFANVLLKGHGAVIRNYIRKYQPDTCNIIIHKNSDLKEDFEGLRTVRSIFGNKKNDTVFVVPPFNYCDDGDSYCFFNRSIPRLHTDSYCCHPSNLFVLPDIDEDGMREIGIYYSSCANRFKALNIYSLKHGVWRPIGGSTFDTFMRDPDKVQFSTLVKKISKGKFRICSFANGKTDWETVIMK